MNELPFCSMVKKYENKLCIRNECLLSLKKMYTFTGLASMISTLKEVNAATDTLEQNQLDITSVTYNCLFNK